MCLYKYSLLTFPVKGISQTNATVSYAVPDPEGRSGLLCGVSRRGSSPSIKRLFSTFQELSGPEVRPFGFESVRTVDHLLAMQP